MPPLEDPIVDGLRVRLQAALGDAYRLHRLLGRGGFGLVFAAEDVGLHRPVAIKLLRPEIAAPVVRERFRREATAAAALQHPGIIPIYGLGEADDLSWFVMPEIRGETLRTRLDREGRLPIAEARRILLEMARALEAAHLAGILHRDIKPDNILLEGDEGRVVLTDFGIAKSLLPPPAASDGAPLTTAGLVLGTPDYMSPEQAAAESALDARSDLYSLGVLGFELLTGRRPFAAASPGALLLRQLQQAAPPVRPFRPECPDALADALARCLEREPAARWDSAADLIAALGRGSTALVRPAPSPPAASGWSPGALLLTSGALVVGAVAGDTVLRTVALTPAAVLVAAAMLASHHAAHRRLGRSWRDIWLHASAGPGPTPAPAGDAGQQARSDRAQLLRDLEAMSRAERSLAPALPREVDRLVAEVERGGDPSPERREAARRLGQLRRLVAQGRTLGMAAVGEELRALAGPTADSVEGPPAGPQRGDQQR